MRARPALTAGFAVVLLVVGQLLAMAHEAEARHATCEQHGEELEAPTLDGDVDHCEHAHLIGVSDSGGDHEDCAIARLLHQSSIASHRAPIVAVTTIVATPTTLPIVDTLPRASIDVVLIAPKTSPPHAI